MLEAVNANFTVVPRATEFGGRQFPQHQLWMRKDGDDFSDCLGCFGTATHAHATSDHGADND